jgi:hypothetical protein
MLITACWFNSIMLPLSKAKRSKALMPQQELHLKDKLETVTGSISLQRLRASQIE